MRKIGPFRRYDTGQAVAIWLHGPQIGVVEPWEGPRPSGEPPWVAPGFWDLQTNGRWGISFASPSLTEEDVRRIVLEHVRRGVTKVFPTLITAPPDILLHGVRTIASACGRWKMVDELVGGIHLEGPWISGGDGYRGAHPLESVRDPDYGEFRRLQDASGGRVAIVTLAPERPGALDLIGRITAEGVTAAIGHTAAEAPTLRAAVDAGARLGTHLGNGIASPLPRHPNPIWHQAADDRLTASLIADGAHLCDDVLRVLARAKGPGRTILVSDLSPLAGLKPGRHGDWEVTLFRGIVLAGTGYLAGSAEELPAAVSRLRRVTGWSLAACIETVTRNPAELLGRRVPEIAPRAAADLTIFRVENAEIQPIAAYKGGFPMDA